MSRILPSQTSDSTSTVTKPDPAFASEVAKVRAIERGANLAALNDYIGVIVSKLTGLVALTVGGLEYLDPNVLAVVLANPGLIAGFGFALLTGKDLITLIAKLDKALKR